MDKHFYEDDGYPQCQQRCIVPVGTSRILNRKCKFELVKGHADDCERIPTTKWATVDDTTRLPIYNNFVSE